MKRYALRENENGTEPFEIIDRPSDGAMILREMACDLKPGFVPKVVLGRCENEADQEWDIQSNPDAVPFRVRHSKYYGWRDRDGNVYKVAEEPVRWNRFGNVGRRWRG